MARSASGSKLKWRIEGFDLDAGESYSISGEWNTEEEARAAAEREKWQNAETEDEDEAEIQIWVIRPDGTRYPI